MQKITNKNFIYRNNLCVYFYLNYLASSYYLFIIRKSQNELSFKLLQYEKKSIFNYSIYKKNKIAEKREYLQKYLGDNKKNSIYLYILFKTQ
jgi:hypothetical protein